MTDNTFDDNDWDQVVETYGATGTGSAGHLRFNGQADADYRQITIHITSGGSDAQLALFSIHRRVQYSPRNDGDLLYVDYSESSSKQANREQKSAPANRQTRQHYTHEPGGNDFTTPDQSGARSSSRPLRSWVQNPEALSCWAIVQPASGN